MLRLVHGWGLNKRVFDGFVQDWPSPVEAIDLPGHGQSPYSAGALALEPLADRLAHQYPRPATWLGWSLGGLVAQVLALRHPQCVRRLILVSATPCFMARADWPCGMPRDTLQGFADSLAQDYRGTLQRFLTLQAGIGDRAQVRRLIKDLEAGGFPHNAALTEGLDILASTDLRQELLSLKTSVVIIHGSDDRVVSVEAARFCAEILPYSTFRLVGRGHAPFLTEPDAFRALLREVMCE